MKKNIKSISIHTIIFISFILILLGTSITTSYIPYSNWWNLTNEATINTTNSLNKQIINEIDIFIKNTKQLNIMNKGLFEKNIIDIDNELERENFFINALSSFDNDSIYSFSYGTESGEYYGARKNQNNEIEVMKNNKETSGHSLYYFVEKGIAAGQSLDAGKFDPRTRDWYTAAKQTNQSVFSPIYKHFVLDDLVISSSIPIYDEVGKLKGVLGSHINLSRIGNYLEDLIRDKNTHAIIIEKESGNIIANSSSNVYFKKGQNDELKRLSIDEIDTSEISQAYEEYLAMGTEIYNMDSKKGDVHIKIGEFNDQGLDWLVITFQPESMIIANIKDNIKAGLLFNLLIIFISSFLFLAAMRRYMSPINSLIQTQEDFANGNLLQREKIVRDDEIGMVSKSFNSMADTIYDLVYRLETQIEDRTQELQKSRDYFETILLSVGEGIIATDRQGRIKVMNSIMEKITGWSNQKAFDKQIQEILSLICESTEKDEDPVTKVLNSKEKIEISGQVNIICKNKESLTVEYTATPIRDKEDNTIGAVIVLRDITDEKKKLEKIKHLSIHDQLTGLYNRWYMEDAIIRLDKPENLPLTVMVVDVNGLKLVNDAFGHDTGDKLLQTVSRVLKGALRPEDILGRVGGDEFLILLPKVNSDEAEDVKQRILKAISREKLETVIISVAIGYSVKENIEESMDDIRIYADNEMYKNKLIHGKTMRNQTIETVIRNINYKYNQEQIHTERVSIFCESIAKAMGFSKSKVNDIKIAGLLHDIGKITIPPELLNKVDKLTKDEFGIIKKHPETGYHILKSVDEYMSVAEDVLYHHERWDGTGYPQGLKGDEIPINARIIAVADAFEAMTAKRHYQKTKSKEEAIAELKRCAGSQFDPEIIKVFLEDVL